MEKRFQDNDGKEINEIKTKAFRLKPLLPFQDTLEKFTRQFF